MAWERVQGLGLEQERIEEVERERERELGQGQRYVGWVRNLEELRRGFAH